MSSRTGCSRSAGTVDVRGLVEEVGVDIEGGGGCRDQKPRFAWRTPTPREAAALAYAGDAPCGQRWTARSIWVAWFPGFLGVDQIEARQPDPQRATPQACPDDFGVTVQPDFSAALSAFSTFLSGCLRRAATEQPYGLGV
jgi:hypothetical protein